MGTVHISIRHDDYLVIAKLRDIKVIVDARAEGSDHGFDLSVAVDPVKSGLLHVKDLSSQGKNGLVCPASRCLG